MHAFTRRRQSFDSRVVFVVVVVFARARFAHSRPAASIAYLALDERVCLAPCAAPIMFPMLDNAARFPAGASVCDRKPRDGNASECQSVARSFPWCRHWMSKSRPSRARREHAPSFIPPGTLRPRVAFSFMSPRMRLARAPAKRTTASVSRCARERTAPFPFCPESIDGSNARDGARTRARRVKRANVCVDAPCRVESSRRSRAVVVGTRRRVRGRDACLFASLVSSPAVWCRKMSDLIG